MDPQPERVATSITIASYARLIRGNRNFRRLWLAQIVSEIGDWFYTLSIYTLLLQLTGAAVNDRLKRKHVMIAADLGRCGVVLAMLFVRSRSTVWLIDPLLVLETTMAAFFEPARSSVIRTPLQVHDSGSVLNLNFTRHHPEELAFLPAGRGISVAHSVVAGDPSLRLKKGYAQDDAIAERTHQFHFCLACG